MHRTTIRHIFFGSFLVSKVFFRCYPIAVVVVVVVVVVIVIVVVNDCCWFSSVVLSKKLDHVTGSDLLSESIKLCKHSEPRCEEEARKNW